MDTFSKKVAMLFGLPGWAVELLQVVVIVIAGVVILEIGLRAFDRFAKRTQFDLLSFRPIRTLMHWLGFILILALVLATFGIDLFTALSAVLTLVAVGFVAMWSVLSNIFCTFLILLFRPFRIGDTVEFPGEEVSGHVVELTNLYTILEAKDGAIYHVPNNLFFQKTLRKRKTVPGSNVSDTGKTIP